MLRTNELKDEVDEANMNMNMNTIATETATAHISGSGGPTTTTTTKGKSKKIAKADPNEGIEGEPTTTAALTVSSPKKMPRIDGVGQYVAEVYSATVNFTELLIEEKHIVREHNAHDIVAMTESVKEHGIKNPIMVFKQNDRFVPFAGLKRSEVAIDLKMAKVPVLVHEFTSACTPPQREATILALAAIENGHRSNPTMVEQADHALRMKALGLTNRAISGSLNVSAQIVGRLLKWVESAETVRDLRKVGELLPFSGFDPIFALPDDAAGKLLAKLTAKVLESKEPMTKAAMATAADKVSAKLTESGEAAKKSKAGRKKSTTRCLPLPEILASLKLGQTIELVGDRTAAAQFENVFAAFQYYMTGKADEATLFSSIASVLGVDVVWEDGDGVSKGETGETEA